MKYIKLFEKLNKKSPQVNDYVLCCHKVMVFKTNDLNDFIHSNIGIIIDKDNSGYFIKYKNIPDDCGTFFTDDGVMLFFEEEIEYWSKYKEDLEMIINIKKYNV